MSSSVTLPERKTITPNDEAYPVALTNCVAFGKPPTLSAIGNLDLLTRSPIAFFGSGQCPSDLIPQIHELAQLFTDAGVCVIGGFQSPIEQACLRILVQGTQPIIHCPARSLHKIRLSPVQQQLIEHDRLLLVSPFSSSYARATAALAAKRNEMISAIARTIVITYAAPDSKTLSFAQRLIQSGKAVLTINSPNNLLLQPGVTRVDADAIVQYCLNSQNSTSQSAFTNEP